MDDICFTKEQVTALCGGKLPFACGFDWDRVEHFKLEKGALEPYSGSHILPGPSLLITTEMIW